MSNLNLKLRILSYISQYSIIYNIIYIYIDMKENIKEEGSNKEEEHIIKRNRQQYRNTPTRTQ